MDGFLFNLLEENNQIFKNLYGKYICNKKI